MRRFAVIATMFLVLSCLSCRQEQPKTETQEARTETQEVKPVTPPKTHEEEIREWQERRRTRLTAEDGWLTLVGLHWLNEGKNELNIPHEGKTSPGTLTLKNGVVTLDAAAPMTIDGKPVTGPIALIDDMDPKGPTVVQSGTVRFQIIRREPRFALRVKDSQAETRTKFKGLDYFPIDPKWRIEARFEPYKPMKKIPIDDVTGRKSDSDSPGALVFSVDGKEYRIDPILEEGSDELFIIFRDATSKDATYGAGRYLYAQPAGPDGKVIVDFNKAYNPPCAFTPYATCPLPPMQNRLPFRIEAGEKKYAGGH
jgi:uncharacterized protein (DUF1684 family)